ncbi:DNA-binding protein [Cupriavidus sp. D39]|uniref:DNA-binding protein n=1 Tax=Cupriavidus sp. D39 TaxID=2997877 RepID=UPI00226F0B06|nr:DNA-binding protein [Cupriavidus sp. D39]MCY0857554.1 DNA-binding protein [Cupriavidus sp. D39]
MSKTLVTYDLVKQKAEDLLAFGISPTQKQIRAALGSIGSMETINRHLRQFWAERQGEDWEFSISREFAAAIQAEFTRVATTSSSELAGRVRETELELEEASTRLAFATDTLERQSRELQEARQQVRGAEAAVEQLRESEQHLRTELQACRDRLTDAREQVQRLSSAEAIAKRLEDEVKEARGMLQAAQSQVTRLLDENKELRVQPEAGRRRAKEVRSTS